MNRKNRGSNFRNSICKRTGEHFYPLHIQSKHAFSTWNQTDYFKQLPIFEIQSSQNFPMEQTLVPIMKRKIMAYIFQIVNSEKLNNFDFEI